MLMPNNPEWNRDLVNQAVRTYGDGLGEFLLYSGRSVWAPIDEVELNYLWDRRLGEIMRRSDIVTFHALGPFQRIVDFRSRRRTIVPADPYMRVTVEHYDTETGPVSLIQRLGIFLEGASRGNDTIVLRTPGLITINEKPATEFRIGLRPEKYRVF